jgi:FtsP/CotA-like multicopper oxidase with cupredoxin domain
MPTRRAVLVSSLVAAAIGRANTRAQSGPAPVAARCAIPSWCPPGAALVVAFDANDPGLWAFHCNLLYDFDAGMFTTFRYV